MSICESQSFLLSSLFSKQALCQSQVLYNSQVFTPFSSSFHLFFFAMASNVASSHPPLSSLASQVSPAPAQGPGSTQRQFGRFIPNGFSLAGSRLPRARPSSAGSPVKHRFTFDFGGFDVLAPPPLLPPLASQVSPAPAQGSGSTQRRSGRSNPDAFSLAGSRLPRARPSSTGSRVEHRSTFDFGGFAVPAATLKSMRKCLFFPSCYP